MDAQHFMSLMALELYTEQLLKTIKLYQVYFTIKDTVKKSTKEINANPNLDKPIPQLI